VATGEPGRGRELREVGERGDRAGGRGEERERGLGRGKLMGGARRGEAAAVPNRTRRGRAWGARGRRGRLGHGWAASRLGREVGWAGMGPMAGRGEGDKAGLGRLASWAVRQGGGGWAKSGGEGGWRKEKGFSFFSKTYFLDEGFHNSNQPK
jgi:hypothetical protein